MVRGFAAAFVCIGTLCATGRPAFGSEPVDPCAAPVTIDAEGRVFRNGAPYRAIGVNYYDAFLRTLHDPHDTTYREGFIELAHENIPFIRFNAGGFWPNEWRQYIDSRDSYLTRFDDVVRAAEATGIGLIPSFFWYPAAVSDLAGEPRGAWGDPSSKTHAFMREYVREIVTRYKNSPAIWMWEFGNEMNLAADLPNAAQHRPHVAPSKGAHGPRSEADDVTHDMLVIALRAFAEEVRKYDPVRPITTGNSIPRPSAENQRHQGAWTSDSREEFVTNLLDVTPDPMNVVSIHVYPEALSRRFGGEGASYIELLELSRRAAREAGKALFVGEFGASSADGEAASARRQIEKQIAAIELTDIPLAAVWVYDFPAQRDDFNITTDNQRKYILGLLAQANRRMSLALNSSHPHIVNLRSASWYGRRLDRLANRYRSGNGFNPLCNMRYPDQNLFRGDVMGFFYEHVFNGMAADYDASSFTPNEDPHYHLVNSERSVTLVHPAEGSAWNIDSALTFTLNDDDSIDIAFRVTPREDRAGKGWLAFMWAAYMNRTRERLIHFYGRDGSTEGWITFGGDTEDGFETGTVACAGVPDLPYEEGAWTLNVIEHPTKKFIHPVYYGLADGDGDLDTGDDTMAYIMMFDQRETIRFALWNFIRGEDGQPDPHSPAWDWQFVIHNPEIGKEYGYRARLLYKPFISPEDVLAEYEKWFNTLENHP